MRLLRPSAALLGGLVLFVALPAPAQQGGTLTAADYARAERFLSPATAPLVTGAVVRPSWLADDRFWYRNATATGFEFILVDPARKTRTRAFDQARIAAALSSATGKTYDPNRLPFTQFELAPGGRGIVVRVEGKRWSCNPETGRCDAAVDDREAARAQEMAAARAAQGGPPPVVVSPDGKRAAFIRDWNLWVRDVATGQDTQLTTDGVQDYGYATDNAGWIHSDRAILAWSPDSRKLATFRQDQRNVGEMYLVSTKVGHPELKAWKYP
ncbi:MAG TPA: DPP IV N-terminal domain-containing protein, partial [Gemmatimonadaceae bacterium]|nr:DPP IV N-terminal domain-containing protein [Gemmatimonadaceae bacterium]